MKVFLLIIGGLFLVWYLALVILNWGGSADDIPMDDYDQMP
jgi:hypothetical protein